MPYVTVASVIDVNALIARGERERERRHKIATARSRFKRLILYRTFGLSRGGGVSRGFSFCFYRGDARLYRPSESSITIFVSEWENLVMLIFLDVPYSIGIRACTGETNTDGDLMARGFGRLFFGHTRAAATSAVLFRVRLRCRLRRDLRKWQARGFSDRCWENWSIDRCTRGIAE